mmetsp:Transcript_29360/g.75108  ORF Transcript_29360/g.75108 Transcript_29360/m.75108 type:complete len:216 (+) Transcript_29360:385-1032(+)
MLHLAPLAELQQRPSTAATPQRGGLARPHLDDFGLFSICLIRAKIPPAQEPIPVQSPFLRCTLIRAVEKQQLNPILVLFLPVCVQASGSPQIFHPSPSSSKLLELLLVVALGQRDMMHVLGSRQAQPAGFPVLLQQESLHWQHVLHFEGFAELLHVPFKRLALQLLLQRPSLGQVPLFATERPGRWICLVEPLFPIVEPSLHRSDLVDVDVRIVD